MIRVGLSAAIKSSDSHISVAHAEAQLQAVGGGAPSAESGSGMILIFVRIAVQRSIRVIMHRLLAGLGEKGPNCLPNGLRWVTSIDRFGKDCRFRKERLRF